MFKLTVHCYLSNNPNNIPVGSGVVSLLLFQNLHDVLFSRSNQQRIHLFISFVYYSSAFSYRIFTVKNLIGRLELPITTTLSDCRPRLPDLESYSLSRPSRTVVVPVLSGEWIPLVSVDDVPRLEPDAF